MYMLVCMLYCIYVYTCIYTVLCMLSHVHDPMDCSSTRMESFEGGHQYLYYLHHSLAQVNGREGTQLHSSTENWIKYLPCSSEQDPVSPSVSLSRQEAFITF